MDPNQRQAFSGASPHPSFFLAAPYSYNRAPTMKMPKAKYASCYDEVWELRSKPTSFPVVTRISEYYQEPRITISKPGGAQNNFISLTEPEFYNIVSLFTNSEFEEKLEKCKDKIFELFGEIRYTENSATNVTRVPTCAKTQKLVEGGGGGGGEARKKGRKRQLSTATDTE